MAFLVREYTAAEENTDSVNEGWVNRHRINRIRRFSKIFTRSSRICTTTRSGPDKRTSRTNQPPHARAALTCTEAKAIEVIVSLVGQDTNDSSQGGRSSFRRLMLWLAMTPETRARAP